MKKEQMIILGCSIILIVIPLLVQPRINAIYSGEELITAIEYSGSTPRVINLHYFSGIALGIVITWMYLKEKYQIPMLLLAFSIIVLQTYFQFQIGEMLY